MSPFAAASPALVRSGFPFCWYGVALERTGNLLDHADLRDRDRRFDNIAGRRARCSRDAFVIPASRTSSGIIAERATRRSPSPPWPSELGGRGGAVSGAVTGGGDQSSTRRGGAVAFASSRSIASSRRGMERLGPAWRAQSGANLFQITAGNATPVVIEIDLATRYGSASRPECVL